MSPGQYTFHPNTRRAGIEIRLDHAFLNTFRMYSTKTPRPDGSIRSTGIVVSVNIWMEAEGSATMALKRIPADLPGSESGLLVTWDMLFDNDATPPNRSISDLKLPC
jgi:hypothetical protein